MNNFIEQISNEISSVNKTLKTDESSQLIDTNAPFGYSIPKTCGKEKRIFMEPSLPDATGSRVSQTGLQVIHY
jgi:hypothetical protein